MEMLASLFNMFSGPIGGLIEKGILGGVMYASGKGLIPADMVGGIATAAYTLFSGLFTAVTKSTTGKALSINTETNGLKVVSASVSAPAVNSPSK